MDKLLETIDEIKTLIPDAKYMTLMESLGQIHKKSLDRKTHYNLKQLISFLLKASEDDSTISYMNASKWGSDGSNGVFYNIVIKCKTGVDCRDSQYSWLEILETSHPKEKFNVADHLPKCEFKNYNWCNSAPFPRKLSFPDEKDIELYLSFDDYDSDDFVNEHGWFHGFGIEDANSIGKSCLTMMAKALVEKYL